VAGTTLKSRKIIEETPGKTIYAGRTVHEVYHCFTDSFICPHTAQTLSAPGKGALTHRLNAFLFSRLQSLGVPTHFVRTCNMRESLMAKTYPLPFTLRLHCRSGTALAQECGMQEGFVLDPPILEYRGHSPHVHLNEEFLLALGWLDQDEIEDMRAMALRVAHTLQGVFAAFDVGLIGLDLTIARSMGESFLIAGELGLEQLCLQDLRTGQHWGLQSPAMQLEQLEDGTENARLKNDYIALTQRLNIYHAQASIPHDITPLSFLLPVEADA
jgi:phosphoribosylaminoimidazole-succinocarboxamide synthase